jgi:triosephosphate isomerase (TIM)
VLVLPRPSDAARRHRVVGGNWKMHLSVDGAVRLAGELRAKLGSQRGVRLVVFPPFPFLFPVLAKLRDSAIEVGAQDVHPEKSGAYTSGVSAPMVRSLGCTTVLVGHSERRSHFGDGDALVAQKLRAVLAEGLAPVLCVGETLSERQQGRTVEVVTRQLATALAPHTADALASLVVAYEPVWAIGTGLTATPAQAQEVHAQIRGWLAARISPALAARVPLQYGGSVNADNAEALLACADIDGALVGGASLDAAAFTRIARAAVRR